METKNLITLPLVSIITPAYNGKDYIAEAIKSTLVQSYPNFELLIINDGSTDCSCDVISTFLKDERIHYFEKENGGVASARNFALKRAKGKYIAFLDQDDLWLPHKLEQQLPLLEQYPDTALVHAKQGYIDTVGNALESYPKDWVAPLQGDCFNELFQRNRIAVLTVLLRKSVLDKMGGFNESVSCVDDYELWLRICHTHKIIFLDETVAHYRVHENNASLDHFRMEQAELFALNNVLTDFPEVIPYLGHKIINQRFSDLHTEIANAYLWQSQDFFSAKRHFYEALKRQPFNTKNIQRLIWCTLSQNMRRRLSWYRSKLRITSVNTTNNSTKL